MIIAIVCLSFLVLFFMYQWFVATGLVHRYDLRGARFLEGLDECRKGGCEKALKIMAKAMKNKPGEAE